MNALDHPNSVLQRLLLDGEAILCRRRIDIEQSLELMAAVARLKARPADGPRVIDDHTMLFASAVVLANKHLSLYDNRTAGRYARIVGVLIDDIRDDFSAAIDQGKRPTA